MSNPAIACSKLSESMTGVFGAPLGQAVYGGYLIEEATKAKVVYIVGARIYISAWWLWQQTEGSIDACTRPFQDWFRIALTELTLDESDYAELTYAGGMPEIAFRLDVALDIYQETERVKPYDSKARRKELLELAEDAASMISIRADLHGPTFAIPDSMKVLPFMAAYDDGEPDAVEES